MLYDICFQKLCNYVEHVDNRLNVIICEIRNTHTKLFDEIFGKILQFYVV